MGSRQATAAIRAKTATQRGKKEGSVAPVMVEELAGFIRHPPSYPINWRRDWFHRRTRPSIGAHAEGVGLLFHSSRFMRPGMRLALSIPLRGETQEIRGEVVVVRALRNGFEIGVWLDDAEDAARARIVEQICYIECYLRARRKQNASATLRDSAASEWITRFAANFPRLARISHRASSRGRVGT